MSNLKYILARKPCVMTAEHDSVITVVAKVAVVVGGTIWGFLAEIGQTLIWITTAVYTMLNIYFLLRDKWWRDKVRTAKLNRN